jgi:hypothetical protein
MSDLEARIADGSKESIANGHTTGMYNAEKNIETRDEFVAASPNLKLDKNGIPLVPQPR